MIKILVADDHDAVREGIRELLEQSGEIEVTGEADNSFDAVEMATARAYDAVILDISMPGHGGLNALTEIHKRKPALPLLILSVHDEEQHVIRAMKTGARGYLTKGAAAAELVTAVQRIAAGGTYISLDLADSPVLYAAAESDSRPHELLSEREYQVMLMMARGRDVSEMANELQLSPNTVATYRTRMLAKLQMKNEAELVAYVLREGLDA